MKRKMSKLRQKVKTARKKTTKASRVCDMKSQPLPRKLNQLGDTYTKLIRELAKR